MQGFNEHLLGPLRKFVGNVLKTDKGPAQVENDQGPAQVEKPASASRKSSSGKSARSASATRKSSSGKNDSPASASSPGSASRKSSRGKKRQIGMASATRKNSSSESSKTQEYAPKTEEREGSVVVKPTSIYQIQLEKRIKKILNEKTNADKHIIECIMNESEKEIIDFIKTNPRYLIKLKTVRRMRTFIKFLPIPHLEKVAEIKMTPLGIAVSLGKLEAVKAIMEYELTSSTPNYLGELFVPLIANKTDHTVHWFKVKRSPFLLRTWEFFFIPTEVRPINPFTSTTTEYEYNVTFSVLTSIYFLAVKYNQLDVLSYLYDFLIKHPRLCELLDFKGRLEDEYVTWVNRKYEATDYTKPQFIKPPPGGDEYWEKQFQTFTFKFAVPRATKEKYYPGGWSTEEFKSYSHIRLAEKMGITIPEQQKWKQIESEYKNCKPGKVNEKKPPRDYTHPFRG